MSEWPRINHVTEIDPLWREPFNDPTWWEEFRAEMVDLSLSSMAGAPRRKRLRWEDSEFSELAKLLEAKTPWSHIVTKLGRPLNSISFYISQAGGVKAFCQKWLKP